MLRRGFTLVELLIVVIIIAILATIAIPKFINATKAANESQLRANLKLLRDAINRFNQDTGYWPANLTELTLSPGDTNARAAKDSTNHVADISATFRGPYISAPIPADPIAGTYFNYNSFQPPTIGQVNANAGTALDGSDYSSW